VAYYRNKIVQTRSNKRHGLSLVENYFAVLWEAIASPFLILHSRAGQRWPVGTQGMGVGIEQSQAARPAPLLSNTAHKGTILNSHSVVKRKHTALTWKRHARTHARTAPLPTCLQRVSRVMLRVQQRSSQFRSKHIEFYEVTS